MPTEQRTLLPDPRAAARGGAARALGGTALRPFVRMWPALEYALRRLLKAVPPILLVALATFLLLRLASGGANDALLGDTYGADPAFVAQLSERYGLDRSIVTQLWRYLTRLVQFDFGWSFVHEQPVSRVLLDRLGITLTMTGGALVIAFTLGSVLGTLAARRPNSSLDHFLRGFGSLFHAMPSYFLGLAMITVFALELEWFPAGGIGTSAVPDTEIAPALAVARHLFMPMMTLVLLYTALYVRLMRASVLQVMSLDYVHTARAKGMDETRLIQRHIARNALLPLVAPLGSQFATLLSVSVAVETLFELPGLGQLAYQSVEQRELHTLTSVILVCALSVVVARFVVDLLHAGLETRITHR